LPRPKYIAPSWDDIYDLMVNLGRRIKESKFKPDVIVGVSRGGWPPARIMSDLLNNPNLANMKVEFYKDIGVRSKSPRITQPVTSDVQNKKVLVVDDVADSGQSLRAVRNHLRRKGTEEIRVCTIYYKPHSIYIPDYFAKRTSSWIIFPWERVETIRLLSKKLERNNGHLASQIVRELRGSGLSPKLVRQLFSIADP
jgi:hypoxanthine phosphoribosyltransferase